MGGDVIVGLLASFHINISFLTLYELCKIDPEQPHHVSLGRYKVPVELVIDNDRDDVDTDLAIHLFFVVSFAFLSSSLCSAA